MSRFCREKGYRPQYVYAWLKGRVPGETHLARLAADLGVSPSWLMFGDPEPPESAPVGARPRPSPEHRTHDAAPEVAVQALREVSHRVATVEPDEAVRLIAETVVRVFGVEGARIFRLDRASGRLMCLAAGGTSAGRDWQGRTLVIGEGVVGRAVRERRPAWTRDVLDDPAITLPEWARARAQAEGHRSVVAVPLEIRGEVIGALGLTTGAVRSFTEEDLALIADLGDLAALALENARLHREGRELADRLRTVNALNRLVSASLDLDEVLRAITRACARLTGASVVAFGLADEASRTLVRRTFSNDGSEIPAPGPVLRYGEGGAGWGALHRQPLNIPDVLADGRVGFSEWWREHDLRSYLALPVLHDDALIGVVALAGRQPFALSESDRMLLDSLVAQAGVAMRNAQLFAETEARRHASEALAEVGNLLSETLDPDVVGQRITASVRQLLRAQSSALYRRERGTGDLIGLAGAGEMGPAFRPGIIMPRGMGAVGLAVRERRPVATENVLADPRISLGPAVRARIDAAPYRAVLAVPLIARDEVIGALSVADAEGRRFRADEARLIQLFAVQAALALENSRLFAETARRWREAEELARVARMLTERLDVAAVGQGIVDAALALFDAQSAGLRLLRPDGSLVAVAWAGLARNHMEVGDVVPAGAGFPARAVAEQKLIWSSDILADPGIVLTAHQRREIEATGDRGFLAAPLVARGRIIGVLAVADQAGRAFTGDEVVLLETLADQAALALENARLYEEQSRRASEETALRRLFQGFLSAQRAPGLAEHAARTAAEVFGADLSGVFLLDGGGTTLRLTGGVGWEQGAVGEARLEASHRFEAGYALSVGEPVVIKELATDPRFAASPLLVSHGILSAMIAPLVSDERCLGVMGVFVRAAHEFTDHDAGVLARLVDHTAVALARSRSLDISPGPGS